MNKSKGNFPFAKMGLKDEKTEKLTQSLRNSIDPNIKAENEEPAASVPTTSVPTKPVSENKPKRGRPAKNKKRVNGRTASKPIYFDADVDAELSRRHHEEGLNISFFVNKLVKEALGL